MSRGEFRFGVALGGGAALGLAHLGVLKVLEREGIKIDLLTGTSMGALVGAAYAIEPDAAAVERRFRDYFEGPQFREAKFNFLKGRSAEKRTGFFSNFTQYIRRNFFYGLSMTRKAYLSEEQFRDYLSGVIQPAALHQTKVPFYPVAADLVAGRERILRRGDLLDAVVASCAIPGLFPPVRNDDTILIDGSWIDTVPIRPAYACGADFVLGIDVDKDLEDQHDFPTGLDVVVRSSDVTRYRLKKLQLTYADHVIHVPLDDVFWGDFGRIRNIVSRGEEAAEDHVVAIKRALRWARLRKTVLGRARARSSPGLPPEVGFS